VTIKSYLRIACGAVAVVLVVGTYMGWVEIRRQQAELQEKLTATQQQLDAADAREEARKSQLQQQLKKIAQQQKSVQSPQQALEALPGALPLPKPLVVEQPEAAPRGSHTSSPPAPKVALPADDLKPLYDYALACNACQDKLAAAQGNLKDEQLKQQALTKERDDALAAAHGGSILQRVGRAAKWLLIGAAAGAVAARAR
jgi:hypothetical protein